jgi:hypothetical protein
MIMRNYSILKFIPFHRILISPDRREREKERERRSREKVLSKGRYASWRSGCTSSWCRSALGDPEACAVATAQRVPREMSGKVNAVLFSLDD